MNNKLERITTVINAGLSRLKVDGGYLYIARTGDHVQMQFLADLSTLTNILDPTCEPDLDDFGNIIPSPCISS